MKFSDKLNLLMAKKNMTQAQLANEIKVSKQAVQFWASGRSAPKGTNLAKLCQFFGVAPEWFENEAETQIIQAEVKQFVKEDTPPDGYVAIPEYELRFAAGPDSGEPTWEEVNDHDVAWYRADYLMSKGANPSRCKRAKVVGDSMSPELEDGDTVLFLEEVSPMPACVNIRDGAIYLISTEGALRVKRLSKIKNGIRVISANPAYPVEDYLGEEADGLRIYGRVIEIIRSL